MHSCDVCHWVSTAGHDRIVLCYLQITDNFICFTYNIKTVLWFYSRVLFNIFYENFKHCILLAMPCVKLNLYDVHYLWVLKE